MADTNSESERAEGSGRLPKVTIGVPVYNGERYLRKALTFLQNQSFRDFELIIADNASTDKTPDICHEFARDDPRIKYVRHPSNLGAWPNFQYVLDKAVGEYFMWAAVDDRWTQSCVEEWVDVLDRYPDCGVVFSDYERFNCDDNDTLLAEVDVASSGSRRAAINYVIRLLDLNAQILYGLFRREVIQEIGVADYDFSGVDIVLKVAGLHGIKIVPNYLYGMGVKGTTYVPYSHTGKKLTRIPLLRSQLGFLRRRFGVIATIPLFTLLLMVMARNKIYFWKY
jgi:glycosyltransferase involved in cell wall biosynthesis